MKLRELLQALHPGNNSIADAQTAALDPAQRMQLLEDLDSILALLNTANSDAAADTGTAERRKIPVPPAQTASKPAPSSLDLREIFDDDDWNADTGNEPLRFMPIAPAASAADRRQLIQSLLEECLPILEHALDTRLERLDRDALLLLKRRFSDSEG